MCTSPCLLQTCVLLCVQAPVCFRPVSCSMCTSPCLLLSVTSPCMLKTCVLLCVYKPLFAGICYRPMSYTLCTSPCLLASVTGLCATLCIQAPVCWHLLQAYVLHCVYKPLFAGICYRPMSYTVYTSPCLLASVTGLCPTLCVQAPVCWHL